jgi:hypothetical protein
VSGDDQDRGPEPGESPKAQHDRELIELLNELRVGLVAGVLLVTDFILSRAAAVAATASIAVVLLVLWYGLALTSREGRAR